MSDVRYVVLSDLHLGAGYSLLTTCNDDGSADPLTISDPLAELATSLRAVLQDLGGTRPQLVLLGDVFDLSFAPARVTMMTFQRLIEAFFASGEPIFADEILYVPGNHDHREWRVMRDAQLLDEVRNQTDDDLPKQPATTPLFDPHHDCQIATALMRRVLGDTRYRVASGYPNVGHRHEDRTVVMHHGHFTEGMYRAVSSIVAALTGGAETDDLDELERVNGPWIDFFWSSFGDQGDEVGQDIYSLYETMLDAGASHHLVERAAKLILTRLGGAVPVDENTKVGVKGYGVTVGGITKAALDLTFSRIADSERMEHNRVLSPGSVDGVRWFLEGPVRRQLDGAGVSGGDTTFVFGHTHKPFQDEMLVPNYDRAVGVYNTGGWVIDRSTLSPVQGGSAVLVSDDAEVAALRLFNHPVNENIEPMHAEGAGGPSDEHNALLQRLHGAVERNADVLAGFTAATQAGILRRAEVLRRRFFDPSEHPDVVAIDDPAIDLRERSRATSASTKTSASTDTSASKEAVR